MTTLPATITVNESGIECILPPVADPASELGRLLREYADDSDVTISIELPDDHGTLLVALEAGSAYLGLDTADGIYQYVADERAEGSRQFTILDQPTSIDARYVLSATAAIELLAAWLAGSVPLEQPAGERQ